MFEFLIIRIGWYFCHRVDTCFSQFLEEMNQPRICILKTASINKFYAFFFTKIINTTIAHTLTQSSYRTFTIILDNYIVYVSATMPILCETIVAKSYIMSIFTQSFYLIVNLFRDTTMLRKTMID